MKKRSRTKLGLFICNKRIEANLTQATLAWKLGNLTGAFISAIEVGKKGFPSQKIPAFVEIFKLNAEEEREFIKLVQANKTTYTINVVGMSDEKRVLVALFTRKIETLSSEKVKALLEILGETP